MKIWTMITAAGELERVEPLEAAQVKERIGDDLRVIACERGALMFVAGDAAPRCLEANPIASGLAGQAIAGPALYINRFGVDVIGPMGGRVASSGGVLVLENGRR